MNFFLFSFHSSCQIRKFVFVIGCLIIDISLLSQVTTPINRKELVSRHTVVNKNCDSLSSLSVGNGSFAFTVDVTGLQSFPDYYQNGIPLGTQSEWGWHSFIDTAHYKFEETLKDFDFNNRKESYSVQRNEPIRNKNASDWFRQNPHRLQLGSLGFELIKKDGTNATLPDIKNIYQQLNLWTGEISSHFTLEDVPVDVSTFVNQYLDVVSVKIISPLLQEKRLLICLRLPYPTGNFSDAGNNWSNEFQHQSAIWSLSSHAATILHQLDSTKYFIELKWIGHADIQRRQSHYFLLAPSSSDSFEFSCLFSQKKEITIPSYQQTKTNNIVVWKSFWTKTAVVDLSGSTDERANELERRIILSQYLTEIQCRGKYPSQETGLTYNSWFGKFHLEMHWWHAVHFALWNQVDVLEKQLKWYKDVFNEAKKNSLRQGYKGVRWQKMTDPSGRESPSSVGSFLIWQQPHLIYSAELCYNQHKNIATLNKYKELVFATADFMASFAFYDSSTNRYILGKGLIPAQERFDPAETFNPTFELAYWHWALSVAQQWRLRSGMQRSKIWDDVLNKLSPLPIKDGLYLATESATDSYSNPRYKTDHPAVLAAYGMLPYSPVTDTTIMKSTFNWVWNNWTWNDTWGWDFPLTAMTATRLGLPDKAIDALLMPIKTNTYLNNGHNYQDDRLRLYLPGNGGLLTAIGLMCAGYEGCKTTNPGFPKNGWKVKWEGLKKIF